MLLALSGLLISCGGGGVEPGFETPSSAVRLFATAIEADDAEAYLSVQTEEQRLQHESSLATMGEAYNATILGTMSTMKGLLEGAEIVGEEIDGDTATVTTRNAEGLEITWNCVRESDGWKVAIGG
jgi:hypothetical protein